MGPGHVYVSANSAVFPHGVRIAFGRHVFELGAACAEEQAVWLAAIEQARVMVGDVKEGVGKELVLADKTKKEVVSSGKPSKELVLASQQRKEVALVEKSSAMVARSKSATATLALENGREPSGANLVRGKSEGSYMGEREGSALGLGLAERVESAFLRDRAGRASDHSDTVGTSPVGYNTSLGSHSANGSISGVARNTSANAGRSAMRLSVIAGPGGTFRGTLSSGADETRLVGSSSERTIGPADARALVPVDARTIGPANGRSLGPADARALTVTTGANVTRTNSSSTGGSRSFPPSPVMPTHALVRCYFLAITA